MRNTNKSVFRINPPTNKAMMLAFFNGLLLQVAVTEITFLTSMFGTEKLSFAQWGKLLLFAVIPLVMHELIVLVQNIVKCE